MNQVSKFLWWMAGGDIDCLEGMSRRPRMLYTTLGMVFTLNFLALFLVWSKVGFHYFGIYGVCLGPIIASIFVLGLDRIIAMRQRPIRGVLSVYGVNLTADSHGELALRVLISLVLCLASTFTFQMQQSHGLISAEHAEQARKKNLLLREEFVARIESKYEVNVDGFSSSESALKARREYLLEEQSKAIQLENEAGIKARIAREEELSELGGLGNRAVGDGVRAKAQRAIANTNDALEAEARLRKEAAAAALAGVQSEIDEINQRRAEAAASKQTALNSIDQRIISDERYVPAHSGLFADATVFMKLFTDPTLAAGMWVFSLITFGILLSIELVALIVTKLRPTSPYDLAVAAQEIREASMIVGSDEISSETTNVMVSRIFTKGLGEGFEGVAGAEEKVTSAKLANKLADVRKKQSEQLAPMDLRLARTPAVGDGPRRTFGIPGNENASVEVA